MTEETARREPCRGLGTAMVQRSRAADVTNEDVKALERAMAENARDRARAVLADAKAGDGRVVRDGG